MKNLIKIVLMVGFVLAGGFSNPVYASSKIEAAQCFTKCTQKACSTQEVWNACFDACKTRLWTIRNCITAAGNNGFISPCQQSAITSLEKESKPLSCEFLCNRNYCGSAKINWDRCYYGCRDKPTSIINCRRAADEKGFVDECQKASNAG